MTVDGRDVTPVPLQTIQSSLQYVALGRLQGRAGQRWRCPPHAGSPFPVRVRCACVARAPLVCGIDFVCW